MRLIIAILFITTATLHAEGLRNIVGIYSNGMSLATGRVAVSTNEPVSFYVGSKTSNAVLVGSSAWSNNVAASVTNGLASTNFVNAAITGGTANISVLTALPSVFSTLYFTNGIFKGLSTP